MGSIYKLNKISYGMHTNKQKLTRRLKILEGQIRGIQNMVEKDAYCIDVIHQSQAIQSALKNVDEIVLQNHLQCCVLDKVKIGVADDKKLISEIMNVFQKSQI